MAIYEFPHTRNYEKNTDKLILELIYRIEALEKRVEELEEKIKEDE